MYSPKLQLQIDTKYETVYLCSALVLDKYRRRGNTKQLVAIMSPLQNNFFATKTLKHKISLK